MTDIEKAGIPTAIPGKDCYISTRYRISSEMGSVNGGGNMYWRGGLKTYYEIGGCLFP